MAVRPANDLDSALKKIRTVYAVLLLTIPLYVYAGEVMRPAETREAKIFPLILAVLSVFNIWSVLYWYRQKVREAREALQLRAGDTKAISRWEAANITLLTICEPFAFYGSLLRVRGGTFLEAVPFYACTLILLLAFTPQRPPSQPPAHPPA